MPKKILLTFLTIIMFTNICSAATLFSICQDPNHNVNYYVDYESIECDIYNPPEYRLHCNVISKTLDTDEYISEEIHYYRYDYVNKDIFFVTYEDGVETEIGATIDGLYYGGARAIFVESYNHLFPRKHIPKDC